MQYKEVSFTSLYQPNLEFHFLRPAVKADLAAPDFFVWGTECAGKIYSWTISGTSFLIESDVKIPTLLLPNDGTLFDVFTLWMRTAFQAKQATEAEWVACLKIIEENFKFDLSKKSIPNNILAAMKSCGFEPHLGVLAQRKKFTKLSWQEIQYLHEKNWNPEIFELTETLTTDLRICLLELLKKNPLSAQQTKEFISFVITIIKKMGDKAAFTLMNSKINSSEEMRVSFFRTAQPELFNLSEQRIHKLRALKAPPRTAIHGDPSFENDSIKITHSPRNMTDIDLFKNWIEDEDTLSRFKELLQIYHQ